MKEDNYESFKFFMEEFNGYYESKTRDLWFDRYAQFYLKYHNPDKALEIFNIGLMKFPNSSLILNGLGDAYLNKGDKKQAAISYKKAIGLAKKNSDPNLATYESNLKKSLITVTLTNKNWSYLIYNKYQL